MSLKLDNSDMKIHTGFQLIDKHERDQVVQSLLWLEEHLLAMVTNGSETLSLWGKGSPTWQVMEMPAGWQESNKTDANISREIKKGECQGLENFVARAGRMNCIPAKTSISHILFRWWGHRALGGNA